MEEAPVIIVGAGPAGLALALSLSRWKIKSIILEKDAAVCEDPRAIAIAGDAHRIIEFLGIDYNKLLKIGQPLSAIHFHHGTFNSRPFVTFDQHRDWLGQVYQPATVLLQPGLEKALRDLIRASNYAELRPECEVTSILEVVDGVKVSFKQKDGTQEIKGMFLVGADGKRGFVRKGYLEKMGIEQRTGLIHYEATWIAANLRITLPTPTSHPNFPLWELGHQPEELWDLFWPDGFHFCNHPKMPVAAGRFGPATGKYWRFEYELPEGFQPDDFEKHLKEQLQPHLTLPKERLSRDGNLVGSSVEFPWDCVKVLRCGPAHFTHKVVNQWFHNSIILIGDAAHVFPPFGAQGIANGIRDAFSLSWRLALLCNSAEGDELPLRSDSLLGPWSLERRKGVDQSIGETMRSGKLLLNKSHWLAVAANLTNGALEYVPCLRDALIRTVVADENGVSDVAGGFFLANERGGRKIAQVCVKTASGSAHLSDQLFWKTPAALCLLILRPLSEQDTRAIEETFQPAKFPPSLLANEVLELYGDTLPSDPPLSLSVRRFAYGTPEDIRNAGFPLLPGYDPSAFRKRFLPNTCYVLVRPDLIVFSEAETPEKVIEQLKKARGMLKRREGIDKTNL